MASLRLSMNSLPLLPIHSSNTLCPPAFSPPRLTFSHCFGPKCRELLWAKQNNGQSDYKFRNICAMAAQQSIATGKKYSKIGAETTGSLSASELLAGAEAAAKRGAEVVMEAVHKPRNIDYKGKTDLVTDTDRRSELAIQEVVRENFKDHLILGEEGGFSGDASSEYLWCLDPLDGTTNFAHGYPSFAVSVGVLYRGRPAAAAVVEFAGGPLCWVTRSFSASAGGGAFCNGQPIHVSSSDQVERSLLITGFGYDHDDAWATNMDLFKEFTAQPAGYREGKTFTTISLKSGHNIRAWIDYDGASKQLDISIASIGLARPQEALLSQKDLNLDDIIQDHMYVGFSASTGSSPLVEDHYILAWSFATGSSKALDLDTLHLPSFYVKIPKFYDSAKFISTTTICSVAFILGLILGTFYWLKRIDYIEFYEKWELQYWPHRFTYRELKLATKGFRDDNFLGSGGFGRVYRGTLASGEEVAVKSITKDCTEGMKEFIAEISSLGRLQHRNLVPLRGWCRKNKRLFIVYDYMSNGSLDRNLFTSELNLTWAQRYKILTGVASGLLYLHEQWEKRVVHRDIKSSNILLDYDLNGRVGDFGLARLYDHSEKPQTTHVVGTLGYIAPELIHSGKASAYTDVFSFGALMLEVACGRKPVDPCAMQGVILVQWVWDLYANKRLLDAVDERLGGDYDKREAEMVLVLGLVCSNPDPQERPSMRQVLQILCGEAALPLDLHVPLALKDSYIDIQDLSSSTPLLSSS